MAESQETIQLRGYVVRSPFFEKTLLRLGVTVHHSASPLDKYACACMPWGCIVRGIPFDKEWLRIPESALPTRINGVPVLHPQGSDSFVVKNSKMELEAAGIPFCRFMQPGQDNIAFAAWGCLLPGRALAEGWIRIPELYVPMKMEGSVVLHKLQDPLGQSTSPSSMSQALADSKKEQGLLDSFRVFDSDGKGFVKVADLKTVMSESLTDDELQGLLREADVYSSGRIDYVKFVKILMAD